MKTLAKRCMALVASFVISIICVTAYAEPCTMHGTIGGSKVTVHFTKSPFFGSNIDEFTTFKVVGNYQYDGKGPKARFTFRGTCLNSNIVLKVYDYMGKFCGTLNAQELRGNKGTSIEGQLINTVGNSFVVDIYASVYDF